MADTRELILKRLERLAGKVKTVDVVKRMTGDINTEQGPHIVLFDGPEQRVGDLPKDGRASATFAMRPEFLVFLQATAADIGPKLSAIRASAIATIVNDEELRALAGPNGWVRYMGSEMSVERGRAVEADVSLVFEIGFVLSPQRLTTS